MDRQEFTLDRCTRGLLTAITILLAVIAVELWGGRPSMLPAARGQIPDSGLQRQQLTVEMRRSNDLLGQILEHLRTKAIKVKMETTDKPGSSRVKGGKR